MDAFDRGEYEESLQLMHPLAEEGHPDAQGMLGYMYLEGLGVDDDATEAERWYRNAAEHGVAEAQFTLGAMYEVGDGVTQDIEEAFKWYRMSAEQGFAEAQFSLGYMCAKGQGVPQNFISAYVWFKLAEAFYESGSDRDNAINNRNTAAKKMTPSQLAEAKLQRRLAFHLPALSLSKGERRLNRYCRNVLQKH